MSSTRKSKDSSAFHQNRYASSAEFERGLLANLVAKRCELLVEVSQRNLIWFVHFLSHQEGGLSALAKHLVEIFPDRIRTKEMAELKLKPGKICNAETVNEIRERMPAQEAHGFMLKGETFCTFFDVIVNVAEDHDNRHGDYAHREAEKRPNSYPAKAFFDACKLAAQNNLEKYLSEICLDPSTTLDVGPWYFPGLIDALREFQTSFVKSKSPGFTTDLGKKVCEVLDYTVFSRGLTLMEGEARTGKSFAARAWCEQHPGEARFIEVPANNDDSGFFRALARGLGLGNFLQYKACEIRERVESVLLTGNLILVLDEAQRLWPQQNLRYGFPRRIVWVMAMANAGVPIAMVSTPQFITIQKAVEKSGWNGTQLTGRIKHYEPLPGDLSQADLIAVAKSVLPEAYGEVLRALAIYARSSARYLAAIDSISTRARYLAMKDGRSVATTADVRKAMQESVIPADNKLHIALELGRKVKRDAPASAPSREMMPARETQPETEDRDGHARSRSVKAPLIAA